MRAFAVAALLLVGGAAGSASPATDRCDGDKDCIAAVKRAPKVTASDERKARDDMESAAAKQEIKARYFGLASDKHIKTNADWDAYLATPEGLRLIEYVRKTRRDSELRDQWTANSPNTFTGSFSSDGVTTTCQTSYGGNQAASSCSDDSGSPR